MATRSEPPKPRLPPPTRAMAWWTFLRWVAGIPLLVAGVIGVIWAFHWAMGGFSTLMPKAESDLVGLVWYLGIVALLYPAMLWVWTTDLIDDLRRRREWDRLSPSDQAARIAEEAAALAAAPARKRRRTRQKA